MVLKRKERGVYLKMASQFGYMLARFLKWPFGIGESEKVIEEIFDRPWFLLTNNRTSQHLNKQSFLESIKLDLKMLNINE